MLLIRSLIFAILIPGVVIPGVIVGVVPYSIAGADARSRHWDVISDVALVPLTIGVLSLAVCVRDFLAVGQGTLAPIEPPKQHRALVANLGRNLADAREILVIMILGDR